MKQKTKKELAREIVKAQYYEFRYYVKLSRERPFDDGALEIAKEEHQRFSAMCKLYEAIFGEFVLTEKERAENAEVLNKMKGVEK